MASGDGTHREGDVTTAGQLTKVAQFIAYMDPPRFARTISCDSS